MSKSLIAFYSRADENYVNGMIKTLKVGNTEIVAGFIKDFTQGDAFKIEQIQSYPKDYNSCIAEAQSDQRRNARPELKSYPDSIDEYDVIYLGFPNYWGTMPMAVFTFLEHFDFTGKTIYPFCTHEGSGMGSSVEDIKKLCPKANVKKALPLHGADVKNLKNDVDNWVGENYE
jgi:flavodoxin